MEGVASLGANRTRNRFVVGPEIGFLIRSSVLVVVAFVKMDPPDSRETKGITPFAQTSHEEARPLEDVLEIH